MFTYWFFCLIIYCSITKPLFNTVIFVKIVSGVVCIKEYYTMYTCMLVTNRLANHNPKGGQKFHLCLYKSGSVSSDAGEFQISAMTIE